MSIYLQLILASFFWGTNVIVMKLMLEHIPFLFLAFLRVFFSLIFLGIFMLYKKESFQIKDSLKIFIVGFLSIYLNFMLTFVGIKEVKGVDNALMNALSPVLTLLFCLLLLHKKIEKREKISICLSLFAFLLSIRFQIFSIQKGFYYLLAGMGFYMLAQVLMQKWKLKKENATIFFQLLVGCLFLLGHCFYRQQINLTSLFNLNFTQWILFLVVSGIGFAYIQTIYFKSIQTIGALKTSFFLSLNPIFTYIESLLFLKEPFSLLHFLSFVILIVAIIISNLKKDFSSR